MRQAPDEPFAPIIRDLYEAGAPTMLVNALNGNVRTWEELAEQGWYLTKATRNVGSKSMRLLAAMLAERGMVFRDLPLGGPKKKGRGGVCVCGSCT